MKKIFILFVLSLSLVACSKHDSPGDNHDLSHTDVPYSTFSATTATAKPGASATVTAILRTALQQTVTVTYNVTGAVTLSNQTVVIDRDKITGPITLSIPANVIVAPATSATITVTMVKAVTASGTSLRIGTRNQGAKVTITVAP